MEASGRAVPIFEPSGPPEIGRKPVDHRTARRLWLLWRERRFLWSVAWKTFVLASVIALLLPKHYEAVVKLVPGEASSSSRSFLGNLASPPGATGNALGMGLDAVGLLGMKTPGAFYVEALKSRSVKDRIIDRFDLRRRYWKLGRSSPRDYYTTRKKLKSFTDIEEDKKSGIITLTVTDYDPVMAARIANAYVEELNKLAADLNTSDAHREKVFLEERLKQAKRDLDEASLALSQFSSRNTIMDPGNQHNVLVESGARIQGEIGAAATELKGLQQIYSDDNVRVRTLKARLVELREQLKQLTGASGADGPTHIASSDAGGYPSLRRLPLLAYKYTDLYRQTKIQESVYEFLNQQYEIARVQEAKELPTVRVMDPAVTPERKSGPIRSLIVGLSMIVGLGLACFWILGKNFWRQIPADDPRRLLATEVASVVRRKFRYRTVLRLR